MVLMLWTTGNRRLVEPMSNVAPSRIACLVKTMRQPVAQLNNNKERANAAGTVVLRTQIVHADARKRHLTSFEYSISMPAKSVRYQTYKTQMRIANPGARPLRAAGDDSANLVPAPSSTDGRPMAAERRGVEAAPPRPTRQ